MWSSGLFRVIRGCIFRCVLEKVVGSSACLDRFRLLLAMVVGIVFLVHPHGIDSFLHYCFFFLR